MQDIIWDGSEQTFTGEQLAEVERILAECKPGDEQCHRVVVLFVPDIASLCASGDYVKHHIDQDHWNNYPVNIAVWSRSYHSHMHGKTRSEDMANMSPESKSTMRENIKKGLADMSPDAKRRKGEKIGLGLTKYHAKLTDEERDKRYEGHAERTSKGRRSKGTKGYIVDRYLERQIEPFTMFEFNQLPRYAHAQAMIYWLLKQKKIEEVGKNEKGKKFYRSLIYKGSQDE